LLEALSKIKQYKWTLLLDSFEMEVKSDYHDRIHKLIKEYELDERIVLFDADHKEIADYMNAADVVVVPSITTPDFKEQYGRVAPEAMACGCLVISSNSGALPELVSDAGWIFPEGNVEELSKLLQKAIELDDISSLGAKASEYAHKNLGINKQTKCMMDVINSI
jgi:glycosyltransferase involved in cell wall biosynthesis